MRWQDERYVRVYTRDTPDWLSLSFLAQGLFVLLLRKVDRAGILPLGRLGKKGAVVAIGHAHEWNRLEPALEELLEDGCLIIEGNQLVVPNFMEAQDAAASDKLRQREHRVRAREKALSGASASRSVTECHGETQDEAERDEASREVTAGTARHGTVQHGTARHGASDGTSTETVPTDAAAPPAAPLNGKGLSLDTEAQALLRLLPARAVDVATSLGLPRGAVDSALEELRGRGLVRLSSGMVPQWERA